ncbi:MAG TPA: hypothetical protein VES88_18995 [Gemmatimonadaceae bacterium]|nr:hypothetical protein [Gemmatimonadaceae bacterium]
MQSPADFPQLAALCRKIERDRGFFCSSYKDTCLRRRISVRMRVKGASSFQEYGSILDSDPLIATLTINVSKFFRNPDTYASIAAKVLPEICSQPHEPDRLPKRHYLFHATSAGMALPAVPRGVAAGGLPRPW